MSNANCRILSSLVSLAVLALVGCSGDDPAQSSGAGGNVGATGGAFATGGATSSNASATGGQVSSGSSSVVSGGAVTTFGGSASDGGTTAAVNSGTSVTGGATSSVATGGTTSTSTKATGGTSSTGGTKATGGTSSTGGTKATGGTSSTGGTKATGGTTSSTGGTGNGTTPVTVWIAGDSTVATCSSACPCGWGGPAAISTYFNSNVTVKNLARGGRSIQTWMYEPNVTTTMGANGECVVTETNSTNWATVLSGIKAGDYLFVQFGINDGSATCDRHVGSARYVTLLKRMGQAALDKGAHPIFLTPVGMIKCSGSSAVASRGFLTETKTAGTALGVPVIDLHALSTTLYNTLAFCPLPAGNTDISATTGGAVGAFFCNDHTHFDASGAVKIAGVVAKALRDQSIGLASYLK